MNYKYAKLVDGSPAYAPNPIKYNGRRIANPKPELLLELGYLPVRQEPYPEDEDPPEGCYWAPVWVETVGWIIQGWEAIPLDTMEL